MLTQKSKIYCFLKYLKWFFFSKVCVYLTIVLFCGRGLIIFGYEYKDVNSLLKLIGGSLQFSDP